MKFGVCNLSVIPVRKSAEHSSEMVTQLLFGDTFDIMEIHDKWILINTHNDKYQGWIHFLQYLPLNETEMEKLKNTPYVLIANMESVATEEISEKSVHLPLGCGFPMPINNQFHIGNIKYIFKGTFIESKNKKEDILKFASHYLSAPYLWGGKTLFGIDCSGFTQIVYKLAGISIPRDASQQAEIGETLNFLSESESGDLAFFDNENGNITHVGIIINGQNIIHASGCVRIDIIDHNGIYNTDLKKYTHSLRLIKRIIS